MKNSARALDIGAKTKTATASENTKTALSTIQNAILCYHTSKRFHLGKLI